MKEVGEGGGGANSLGFTLFPNHALVSASNKMKSRLGAIKFSKCT